MDEIVNYVLNHFGIVQSELKPHSHPTQKSLKTRIILSAFLKERGFKNEQIAKVFYSKDVTNIYLLKQRFYNNDFPELSDLHRELSEKFKDVYGEKETRSALKRCTRCKVQKINKTNFRVYKNGRYFHECFDCEAIPIQKIHKNKPAKKIKKVAVTTIKVFKPKTIQPKVIQPKIEVFQEKNNQNEKELLKNGSRFVKSTTHIRAYVLKNE